jgi:hypothetical protein
MKTTNFGFRNLSVLSLAVCCLVFLFVLGGCKEYTLWTFSGLEEKALENGTISVGAARIMDYNNNELTSAREQLIADLNQFENDLNDINTLTPQFYGLDIKSQMLAVCVGYCLSKYPGDFNQSGKSGILDPCELSSIFHSLMKTGPRPSEIEMVGLKMATMKFIETEKEELRLSEVYPVPHGFNRYEISLDLTGWVTGKAKAALVYIDVYPHGVDSWCHPADILGEFVLEANHPCYKLNETKWEQMLRSLGSQYKLGPNDFNDAPEIYEDELPEGKKCAKCVNLANRAPAYDVANVFDSWLQKKDLLPRIVQVERMNPGEYSVLAQGNYSSYDLQGAAAFPSGVSGSVRFAGSSQKEGMGAKVQPLNLTFVAGERRAGWLFMPLKSENGKMPPTERKLRMVVDIPAKLKRLGIYVHKAFLDENFHIISGSDFTNQMDNREQARKLLKQSDSFYEQYKDEQVLDRIITTRIRNLLNQGWSEEIVVDIPDKVKKGQQ